MRGLLLAGGYGKRLAPLTFTIPKCLAPIGDKPLLGIWIKALSEVGISQILINTHYLSEQVAKFCSANNFNTEIKLAHEDILLGTAATIRANRKFVGDHDLLMAHADNYYMGDLSDFVIAHSLRPKKCVMSMLVFRTNDPQSCGIVQLDKDNTVVGFQEKSNSPSGDIANGAIYLLSKEFFKLFDEFSHETVDFSAEVIPRFVGKIFAVESKKALIDIGTPSNYELANRLNALQNGG